MPLYKTKMKPLHEGIEKITSTTAPLENLMPLSIYHLNFSISLFLFF